MAVLSTNTASLLSRWGLIWLHPLFNHPTPPALHLLLHFLLLLPQALPPLLRVEEVVLFLALRHLSLLVVTLHSKLTFFQLVHDEGIDGRRGVVGEVKDRMHFPVRMRHSLSCGNTNSTEDNIFSTRSLSIGSLSGQTADKQTGDSCCCCSALYRHHIQTFIDT
jgi:hypothetical protein